MALVDLFRRKYKANVWCDNCKTHSEVTIPKGVTVNQFTESGSCPLCGCSTLVQDYQQIEEFRKPQVEKVHHTEVVSSRPPQPIYRVKGPKIPRPSNQHLYEGPEKVLRNPSEIIRNNSDYPFKQGARPRNNQHDPQDPNWWTGEGLK